MMGCDIHVVLEKKFPSEQKWIGVWFSDEMIDLPMVAKRNYDFFAKISNVRNDWPITREYSEGFPLDVSNLAQMEYMRWETEHYSPSYMDAKEFCEIHHEAEPDKSSEDNIYYDVLGIDSDEIDNYRVVFWFDH